MTVGRLLFRSARIWPDKVAAIAGADTITYERLERESCRFGRALQATGIEVGDRVSLILPNGIEFLIGFFAVSRIGAVLVPLNPAYADDEFRHILADAEVRLVVCRADHRERIEALQSELPMLGALIVADSPGDLLEQAGGQSDDLFGSDLDEGATHAILYTSGTTGRPKGAILSHRSRLANSLSGRLGYEVTADTRACVPAPMFHSGGMILGLINVLSAGGTLIFPQTPGIDAMASAIADHGANLITTVPTHVFRMIESPEFHKAAADKSFALIHGASPIAQPLVERLFADFPDCRPFHGYGSTEACQLTALAPEEYRRFPTATGRPLPGVDVRVVREDGSDVAPGEVGEIVTAGAHVFDGYLNAPEQTAEALHDGLHWTGDLATLDERGLITIVGRRKDMIISGGFNVYAREVEDVIHAHPAVQEAAIFGVPDAEWGEAVTAAVIVRPGMHVDEAAIVRLCRERLASYKKPQHVWFVDTLPRNTIGKVMKPALAEAFAQRQ